MAVLPPLALGVALCVLVGDSQQLPATVISKAAGALMYSRSLFERFQQAGCPTMLLSLQYRMHPHIWDFLLDTFIRDALLTVKVWLNCLMRYTTRTLYLNLIYSMISDMDWNLTGGSVSYQNIHEAQFCLRLYDNLQKTLKSYGVGKITVGIITPYKLQLKCLQREFEEVLNSEEGNDLYINAGDAFQGQELDVIIMSCVRPSSHGGWLCGRYTPYECCPYECKKGPLVHGKCKNALVQSDDWAALITGAKSRNCYMEMDSLPKDFLVSKGPAYTPLPGKASSTMRGLRSAAPRYRPTHMHMESRLGAPFEDDD